MRPTPGPGSRKRIASEMDRVGPDRPSPSRLIASIDAVSRSSEGVNATMCREKPTLVLPSRDDAVGDRLMTDAEMCPTDTLARLLDAGKEV